MEGISSSRVQARDLDDMTNPERGSIFCVPSSEPQCLAF